jgi:rSAM/selenodomain-associated transferase 1
MDDLLDGLTVVIMARRPRPGRTKTRLMEGGFLDPERAAAVAAAMLECSLARLIRAGGGVLALDEEGSAPAAGGAWLADAVAAHEAAGGRVIDQGTGDLGTRLDRVWRSVGPERPIAFFGADTPDVPDEILGAIVPALAGSDVAVGPTEDGGYWTLAARRHAPAVLARIDWGSESVYDQTRRRARASGLSFHELPAWCDVDRPADVRALHRRLVATSDPSLRRLADRLDELLDPDDPA